MAREGEPKKTLVDNLRDLADSMWEELFAYQTMKIVRAKDWRLSVLKKIFNSGILLYVLFFMVFFHGYSVKEEPDTFVNAFLSDYLRENKTLSFAQGTAPPPEYCNNPRYALVNVLDPVRAGVPVFPVGCNADPVDDIRLNPTSQSIAVRTFTKQVLYSRECSNETVQYSGDPGQLPTCNTTWVGERNQFTAAVEDVLLIIDAAYRTSWGRERSRVKTSIFPRKEGFDSDRAIDFPADEIVAIRLGDLLGLADITLDDLNNVPSNSVLSNNGSSAIPYRVTGAGIVLEMNFMNFYEEYPLKPFDFSDTLRIGVYLETKSGVRILDSDYMYPVDNKERPERLAYHVIPTAVEVTFNPGGLIQKFSFGALMTVFVNAVVLFAVATLLVDITATFIIQGFKQTKFEDRLELRIRRMLRSNLIDGPTLKEFNIYYAVEEEKEEEAKWRAEKERQALMGGGKDREEILAADLQKRREQMELEEEEQNPPFPVVETLVVDEAEYHGQWFHARAVLGKGASPSFQWYASYFEGPWEAIPGATQASFFSSADDIGCALRVECTPVNAIGAKGTPVYHSTGRLQTGLAPRVYVRRNVRKRQGCLVQAVLERDMQPVTIEVDREELVVVGENDTELFSHGMQPGPLVLLVRTNPKVFVLTDERNTKEITLRAPSGHARDVIALTIRAFAGDADVVECLGINDPEPSYS